MKVPALLLKILPSIVFTQATWTGSRLRKHDRSEAQHLAPPTAPFHPEHNPFQGGDKGTCKESGDCVEGCFCGYGSCKYYGGVKDKRCNGKENGTDLEDGGFCWDGRRDRYCAAADRKSEMVDQSKNVKKPSKEQPSSKEGADSEIPGEEVIEEKMEQAQKDLDKTKRRAGRMDPYQMFLDDMHMMLNTMMPGKKPNVWKKLTEMWLTFVGVMWLIMYVYVFYENDRSPTHARWSAEPAVVRQDDPRIQLMKPDVVLVFHKPDFDYPDKESEVHASVLEGALVGKHSRQGHLPRSEALMDAAIHHHSKHSMGATIKRAAKTMGRALSTKPRPNPSDHEEEDADDMTSLSTDETTGIKMGEFRSALLQDFCELLPAKGFDVAAFTSVDGDEIFLCVGLRNEHTVRKHLQRYGMKLQLKQEAAQILNIDQPPDEVESSPPFIRYDRRLAENVFGEGKTDLDVFKNWGLHSGYPVVVPGTDRIRIIHQRLNASMNLDYAVANQLLVQWYPAHGEIRLAELQANWARWSLLTDLSVRQPLTSIREYYGCRIAFIFGWMGCYTKCTLCLLPVALVWVILNFVADMVGKQEFWHRGSVLGISIVIIIWGKMANNLWKKEEEFFTVLWGVQDVADTRHRSQRPDFHGVLKRDIIDGNNMSLQYPEWKYGLRMLMSWVVTLCFCALVFSCVIMWLDLFSGRMNMAAAIWQAIMIQVFTLIYNWMAEALTLAENHKYEDSFYNSYLQKMFIFQLVNQYSAFFYMAVKQQYTPKGCPDDDCVGNIQKLLPVTLLILTLVQFVQVFVGTLLVRFNLWYEQYQMKSKGMAAPVYSFVEEQAKYGQFHTREQIEVMTQLSLTLGYILIFGCVAPRIVPLCFVIFMFQVRSSGMLMTTVLQRTVPAMTVGIEQWNRVFYFLMIVGVLFSAYLLVQFAPLFQGTFLITKLTGFFLYCFLVAVVWECVDIACPTTDPRSVLLGDRRQVVEATVMQNHEDSNFEGGAPTSPHLQIRKTASGKAYMGQHQGTEFHTEELVYDAFANVPKLIPVEEDDAKHISHNDGGASARP